MLIPLELYQYFIEDKHYKYFGILTNNTRYSLRNISTKEGNLLFSFATYSTKLYEKSDILIVRIAKIVKPIDEYYAVSTLYKLYGDRIFYFRECVPGLLFLPVMTRVGDDITNIIVVLGNSQSNTRKKRVEASIREFNKCCHHTKDSKEITFLLFSGCNNEAEEMMDYARFRGVPCNFLMISQKSRNTVENIKNSIEMISSTFPFNVCNVKYTFVSSSYHMFRVKTIVSRFLSKFASFAHTNEIITNEERYREEELLKQYFGYPDNVFTDNNRITEILPNLYLGNYFSCINKVFLKERNIYYVINASDFLCEWEDIKYMKLYICDTASTDISMYFSATYNFIEEAFTKGKSILIHCTAGVSRSATLLLSYLMKKNKWSYDQSLLFLRSKRRIVNPNIGFITQLEEYEKTIS